MSKEHIASDFWPPKEGYIIPFDVTAGVTVSTAPVSLDWKGSYVTFRVEHATVLIKFGTFATSSITSGAVTAGAVGYPLGAGEERSWRVGAEQYLVMCAGGAYTCRVTAYLSSGK